VMDILRRRRLLLPMPPSLQNVPLKIEYKSIMKLAQLSAESVSLKDFFATAGGLSSAAKAAGVPDPIRTIKLDKALSKYGMINNVPSDIFFTDQEVAEHDQARQQAMAAAQAPQQAMAGVQAAKTLSETQMGGGNALGAILGGQGGGGGGA